MRVAAWTAVASWFLANSALARPADDAAPVLVRRGLTPDNTCGLTGGGGNNGYTCDPKLPLGGTCCSASGYCGNSTAYCGTGCQAGYGTCTGTTPPITNFQCGPTNGNQVCGGGLCCSSVGWCGNSTAYCGTGCQGAFGTCSSGSGTGGGGSTTGTGGVSKDGTCGGTQGLKCPAGQCCSPGNYCGTGIDYCADPACQYQFGKCDSDTTPSGTSTLSDPRPLLGSISYTDDLYDCVKDKVVALTYDDGPYIYTSQLLDVLKQFGFKATFFVTGNNLGKGPIDTTAPYPDLLKRMIAEGHQVASHTWSHYNLTSLTTAMRKSQMAKNERAIANIIGKYPTYMRPPFSECSQASGCWDDMKALGYHRTYFDLDTSDYLNDSPDLIQNSKDIVKAALASIDKNGDYLSIQHDIHQQSVANLSSYYFNLIKSKGWKGVTVGDCLNDPATNWYRVPGTGQAAPVSASSTTKPASSTTSAKVAANTKAARRDELERRDGDASTCDVQAGGFCGTIQDFEDQGSCQEAAHQCFLSGWKCMPQARAKNAWACREFTRMCFSVDTYCKQCKTCTLAEFRKFNKQTPTL